MTDTAARLRRLGGPHARARAGAVLLTSAGVAFAIAGAGVRPAEPPQPKGSVGHRVALTA